MRKTLLTVSALFCFVSVLFSTIIGVPSQYSTIQAAINSAASGDTVLVEPGTYFENINFRGKDIVLTSRFYQTGTPSTINATIINGSTPTHPDTCSCVIISSGEDSTTVLQGFTLTGGTGTKWDDEHAPGYRFREGGGLLIQYSAPIIQNNIIRNNQAINNSGAVSAGGGGIRMGDSNPKILNNIIMQNQGLYGPGIVLNYSAGVFKNNVICLNSGATSYGGGGGFWILGTTTLGPRIIENNTIVNNSAISGCGGIQIQSSTVTIRNNIIRGNTPSGNLQIQGGGTISYCNIQGTYSGPGNINVDPIFADSNYILQTGSPCVDAGDSSTVYNDPADPNNPTLAGYPSRGTLRNDMGAYGGPLRRILTDQLIGIVGTSGTVPNGFVLNQNYPNPFNPNTMISFSIPASGDVNLSVFDITGREVAEIFRGFKPAGSYEVNFNSAGLSSGVYFYRLSSGSIYITRKMLLVK